MHALALSLILAAHVWGGPAPTVEFVPLPSGVAGQAIIATHTIQLNRTPPYGAKRWPHRLLCDVILHEDGHLHGMGHSTNPHSIMYPTWNYYEANHRWYGGDTRCEKLFPDHRPTYERR